MESGTGKEHLMKVISILKTVHEQEKCAFDIQELIGRKGENSVTLISKQICKLKEVSDQKKICLNLMDQVVDWWDKMVEDRERLLLTIADMELEKQNERKILSAKEIYKFQRFEDNKNDIDESPVLKKHR